MVLLSLLALQSRPSVPQLDALLRARDVPGLTALMADPKPPQLKVIKTNGAYDTGSRGWRAIDFRAIDSTPYVVFVTPLTSEDIGEMLFRRDPKGLVYVPETDAMGVRVVRHRFDVKFVPARKSVVIRDELSLEPDGKATGPMMFRMSPQYVVNKIQAAGKPVRFTQAGGIVSLPRPADATTYVVSYAAIVDQPGYAGSISTKEATLTNDYWYPMIARQPAPYDITIHAPAGWTPVGQGERVSHSETAQGSTASYRMDVPCVYYSVSAAPYRVTQQRLNGRNYQVWSLKMSAAMEKTQTVLNQGVVEFYDQTFGKWPFTGWGSVDSPTYGGGALEAYSFATYGEDFLPGVDAHEPSHTFWGGVLCNTYLSSFWNESFADFSDGLYHRNARGGNLAEKRAAFVADSSPEADYNAVAISDGNVFAGPVAGSLGYGKGSKVLQMLEQYLGTDGMVKTLRDWIAADRGKAVDWPDYEKIVYQDFPEKNLKPFFDDWIRKPGVADIKVSDVTVLDRSLSFQLDFQSGSYRMPLEVLTVGEDGQRTYQTIDVDGSGRYTIPTPNKAVLLSVDPWLKALRTRSAAERTVSIERLLPKVRFYCDPRHPDYLSPLTEKPLKELPTSLKNVCIVGHPDTLPILRKLCEQAGFVVSGNHLTYRGTTVDLNAGGAVAALDLPEGGQVLIGLGKVQIEPEMGNARLAVFDQYGCFLRGVTDPKVTGPLTFKLQ